MVLPLAAYSTYAERRVSAIIQDRVGPNRSNPATLLDQKDLKFFGLIQPLADGLKGLFKEDHSCARQKAFWLLTASRRACIHQSVRDPFGSAICIFGEIKMVIADIGIGPLFIFAIASLSVYGITLAG